MRMNHAAESDSIADHLGENVIAHEGATDATLIASMIDAHRHAVLALVEQQRIANLIALAASRNPILREQVAQDAAEALAAFHEHADLAMGGWHEVHPDIAAALGIEAVDHD